MSELYLQFLPLHNRRVLVPRTSTQSGILRANLQVAGAIPIELPVIRIAPPANWQALDQALSALISTNSYDWLVFTSANGVKMVLERLRTLGLEPRALRNIRIVAIGLTTATALEKYGLSADLVPDEYIAEGVAEALHNQAIRHGKTLQGKRILLARAAQARQVLVSELERAGARVDVVVTYQTLPMSHDDERGREVITLLRQQQLDIITFTSSSTVHHFMLWLSQSAPDITIWLAYPGKRHERPLIACSGPITASTARSYGLEVGVEAREFTIAGLVEALIYEETLN